jgi:hypothetical protein
MKLMKFGDIEATGDFKRAFELLLPFLLLKARYADIRHLIHSCKKINEYEVPYCTIPFLIDSHRL